ncbi:Kinase-like protein [Mycena venus]|uniref:Kinase-like protein n=1 Tax=Mycena venus TaxID=2733690 RepID=A0A8H7CLA1_9AGAR|nr:Kinase-like protein [Mycena venus]
MSLDLALNVVLGITPVPGLAPAFTVFKFIVSCVQDAQASKKQLGVLANALGQLQGALYREFQSSRLISASLLEDIHRFVQIEQDRGFLKSLFHAESCVAAIELFYNRITTTTSAFQADNGAAQYPTVLEHSHNELRRALDINHRNMLAMMVSIERRMDENRSGTNPEQNFYSHTLQYFTSTSGQHVKLEDWMISPFDVDYGPEIGSGGFTWNWTEVAIKLIHNASGVAANVEVG